MRRKKIEESRTQDSRVANQVFFITQTYDWIKTLSAYVFQKLSNESQRSLECIWFAKIWRTGHHKIMYLKLILEMVKEQNKTKDEAQDESLNICYLEKQGITSPTYNYNTMSPEVKTSINLTKPRQCNFEQLGSPIRLIPTTYQTACSISKTTCVVRWPSNNKYTRRWERWNGIHIWK